MDQEALKTAHRGPRIADSSSPRVASETHVFDWNAQNDFARLSGDRNPMHMDAIAARRTQAGQPTVHGMHAVLWSLDVLARNRALVRPLAQVKVEFRKLIYVGDEVALEILSQDAAGIRAQLSVDGLVVTFLKLTFGEAMLATTRAFSDIVSEPPWSDEPAELSLDQMGQASGWLTFQRTVGAMANLFPAAAAAIDARRVAGLACLSRLVGMVCPGLHSIFSGFTLRTAALATQPNAMFFQVTSLDERFRLIEQSIEGGGWSGRIESFARVPPVAQPSLKHLAQFVGQDEFRHSSALVVGGSRGLGELTAKLIAAGGGAVTISYSVGHADALEVQRQIREWGGKCEILPYDATKPAESQLHRLKRAPASLYYFATPTMARGKASLYTPSVLDNFLRVYVDGFHDLVQRLSQTSRGAWTAFYPSSIAIEEHPAEMTEYAMAKAAGEVLCADLARFSKGLRVVVDRLPRMLTDLTATVVPVGTAEPLDVMLPIVRRVEVTTLEPTEWNPPKSTSA
jgi:acyl dehydratase/NAD(P)-dependent dehydrogenase (short-subunit alcohol dehydrogenase family)